MSIQSSIPTNFVIVAVLATATVACDPPQTDADETALDSVVGEHPAFQLAPPEPPDEPAPPPGAVAAEPNVATQSLPASMAYRMHDFDGDGADDLMCHDFISGKMWLDRAEAGEFDGTDWPRSGGWCYTATQNIHWGDFNGDGRDDALCHDDQSGQMWVSLANASGELTQTDFTAGNWCYNATQELLIGDFSGDGLDDLLCHDRSSGTLWLDYADAADYASDDTYFMGTDGPSLAVGWCTGNTEILHVGRLGGDDDDDLLCHDTSSGDIYLAFTVGEKPDPELSKGAPKSFGTWCNGADQDLMLANVHGSNGADELICFDSGNGRTYVDVAPFSGNTDWVFTTAWCNGTHEQLHFGDTNGDGLDDRICHDIQTGERRVDYAYAPTDISDLEFDGDNWSSNSGWCTTVSQILH